MKKIKLIISLAVVGLLVGQAAQAVSISGEIFFSSTSAATLDAPQATATTVTFAGEQVVTGLGDYSTITSGTAVTFASPFVFGSVGTTGANVVTPLWTLVFGGKTYEFDLSSITINAMAGSQRNLEGLGTAKITGFDDTPGLWSMNFSGSTTMVAFSAATNVPPPSVPDSGATSALLGMGLLGLAGAARRFKK